MKTEGLGAFYKGIGPAWLREASYTSLRLGLDEPIKGLVGATAGAVVGDAAGAVVRHARAEVQECTIAMEFPLDLTYH